ncbi:Uncharacterised protein [Serratia rubidaea]|nr:Uncharacterised protein [Serratia rubidaea]
MSNETKSLEELAQPVAWPNNCNRSAIAALRYLAEKPRPAYGNSAYNTEHLYMIAGELTRMSSQPLYSQECVDALQQRSERLDAMLTESVEALKAAEQRVAEAEIRGVEKLAAAFKSWSCDDSFPDHEAQRHWATASKEASSFADDLRNGDCDDR